MHDPPSANTRSPHELRIGREADLRAVRSIPELRDIDREIGEPYIRSPPIFNSEAWSRRLELPWVVGKIGPPHGKAILDVGSGASALPIYLARQGATVVSVDPSPPSRRRGSETHRVQAALPRLPFRDRSFDVVTCVSVLEHLPLDLGASVGELCRVARHRVILTFDVALGPLAWLGLGRSEVEALADAVGVQFTLPPDPLTPGAIERSVCGPQVSVGLACMDRAVGGWPSVSMGAAGKALVRLHRAVQRLVRFAAHDWRQRGREGS